MLNKLHEILRDPECAGNIKSVTWACVVITMYLSFLLYGFSVLETVDRVNLVEMEQQYEVLKEKVDMLNKLAVYQEDSIKTLDSFADNHTHRYHDGKAIQAGN